MTMPLNFIFRPCDMIQVKINKKTSEKIFIISHRQLNKFDDIACLLYRKSAYIQDLLLQDSGATNNVFDTTRALFCGGRFF